MPYSAISELPPDVRDRLTADKQRQWMAVFNSTLDSGGTEAEAFQAANGVAKRKRDMDEFTIRGEITKLNEELQIAWGWAYVSKEKVDGDQVVDYSGEFAEWQEVQKTAHQFVLESGIGDVMHVLDAGHIVDSIFFSPDIQKALGIDVPVGWFVGYHIENAEVWKAVKDKTLRSFSIGGSGIKEAV